MITLTIFDTLLEPVFALNKKKEILYCNEAAATLASSTPRKLTRAGTKITDIFDFQVDVDFLNLEKITEPTPYKELRFKNPAGASVLVQITLQRLITSEVDSQWLMFIRDVTLEEQLQNKYRAQLEQKEVVIEELRVAQSELQNYSKNLENIVAQRTQQISELNTTMMALLDSLNEGFFIFNEHGDCLPVFSKACETILETRPAGKKIWDVLKLAPNKVEGLKRWMTTLFSEMLPFEDLIPLGPGSYVHSLGKKIKIEYFPLREENRKIKGVVVMASDITDLVQAQLDTENEKARVRLVLQIIQNKKHIAGFVKELESWFALLNQQVQSGNQDVDIDTIKRALHTIKGNASQYSIKELIDLAHVAEEKVSTASQSEWMIFLSECVSKMQIHFSEFLSLAEEIVGPCSDYSERKIEVFESDLNEICDILNFWSKGHYLAWKIQDQYLSLHLHSLFEPFNQVIQQTAHQLHKQVHPLKISGENIVLNNLDLSNLFSTLVHCFRNSIDHGLELPDVRKAGGKPVAGLIEVTTQVIEKNQKKYLFFQIQDDGAGISPHKIREKLKSRSINVDHESDDQVIQHIFDSAFSTSTEITEISGRGVGLDAVKAAVENLSGQVHVKSKPLQGSLFEFLIPLNPHDQKNQIEPKIAS
ncbi:MAG: ATP-binding protein [Bdellovibrionota bacterium]